MANSVMACVVGLIIPIWLAPTFGEPEVAVGPGVIPLGTLLAVGMANSVMACVVGLIIPIWLAVGSVNQRLPSGPAVIPTGSLSGRGDGELGDGVRRRVDHPDLVGIDSR